MVTLFSATLPMFLDYGANNSMRGVGQQIRDDLKLVISKSVNGVNVGPIPSPPSTATKNMWFFAVKSDGLSYNIGSCHPEIGYNTCISNAALYEIKNVKLPNDYKLVHDVSLSDSVYDLVLYFTPIYGELDIYDSYGSDRTVTEASITLTRAGSANAITFKISALGKISESANF